MAGSFPQDKFGSLRSQARLANIAMAKKTDYWAGSTWVYNSRIVNDGVGTQLVTVVPGEDNEMELLYGSMLNRTGGNITGTVRIRGPDDTQLLTLYRGVSNSFNSLDWPTNSTSTTNALPGAGQRYILSGLMQLELDMSGVPDAANCEYSVVARVRGSAPDVTEFGQGAFVVTINTEKFF